MCVLRVQQSILNQHRASVIDLPAEIPLAFPHGITLLILRLRATWIEFVLFSEVTVIPLVYTLTGFQYETWFSMFSSVKLGDFWFSWILRNFWFGMFISSISSSFDVKRVITNAHYYFGFIYAVLVSSGHQNGGDFGFSSWGEVSNHNFQAFVCWSKS